MIKLSSNTKKIGRHVKSFHEYVSKNLNSYVEVNSYLCKSKLYGVIVDYDNVSLTLSITYTDDTNSEGDHAESLYIPLNSIKSIKKL